MRTLKEAVVALLFTVFFAGLITRTGKLETWNLATSRQIVRPRSYLDQPLRLLLQFSLSGNNLASRVNVHESLSNDDGNGNENVS